MFNATDDQPITQPKTPSPLGIVIENNEKNIENLHKISGKSICNIKHK